MHELSLVAELVDACERRASGKTVGAVRVRVAGTVPTELVRDTTLGGLRASYRKQALDWLALEVGLDAELTRSSLARSGSIGAPPREGDLRVFGQPPPDAASHHGTAGVRVAA